MTGLKVHLQPDFLRIAIFFIVAGALAWGAAPPLWAASAAAAVPNSLPADPRELVRLAVQNDLKQAEGFAPYSFQFRKQTPAGSRTELLIGTRDGYAGRTVAVNDHALTAQQQSDEDSRLNGWISDPSRLQEKLAKQKENRDRSIQIVSALPTAFLYEYEGTEQRGTQTIVQLKFRPDPKYDPPTRLEMVLTTMTGTMLIEPKLLHLARIEGTLQSDVAFGWGILGHLDKGGHILLEQSDIGDGTWQQTHMILNFTGRLLLFKSIDVRIDQTQGSFERVASGLTFAEGVEWLNKHAARK